MNNALVRLALLQFVTVFYCIIVIGVVLKIRFGGSAPPIFATHLRDYGVILLLVPTAWCIWGAYFVHHPRRESGDAREVFGGGVALLAILVVIAFFGTISAATYGMPDLVISVPPERHDSAKSQLLAPEP